MSQSLASTVSSSLSSSLSFYLKNMHSMTYNLGCRKVVYNTMSSSVLLFCRKYDNKSPRSGAVSIIAILIFQTLCWTSFAITLRSTSATSSKPLILTKKNRKHFLSSAVCAFSNLWKCYIWTWPEFIISCLTVISYRNQIQIWYFKSSPNATHDDRVLINTSLPLSLCHRSYFSLLIPSFLLTVLEQNKLFLFNI